MDIVQATKSYEQWMRNCTTIVESHLRFKHKQMKDDLFLFFSRDLLPLGATLAGDLPRSLQSAPRSLFRGFARQQLRNVARF
jgi:hypothetical protein